MLGRSSTTERLFQFIGNISTDEHSFTIDHLFWGLLVKIGLMTIEGRFACCMSDELQFVVQVWITCRSGSRQTEVRRT